jgi:hypothetical protein
MTGWWFGTEFYTFSWECHHPNWRTHIFQRGRAQPPTRGALPNSGLWKWERRRCLRALRSTTLVEVFFLSGIEP